MKLSNLILLATLGLGTAAVFGSNYVIKKEYDKIDKTDPYWNFKKMMDKPFTHLVIKGGNITNVVLEESAHAYVKILQTWRGADDGAVKSYVRNDTLYVDFENHFIDLYEKYWLQGVVPVRISSPEIASINGVDTKLVFDKFNHPDLKVELHGDSKLQVNCFRTSFNKIDISQTDSSLVAFTVSEDLFIGDSINIKSAFVHGTGTSLVNLRTATIDSLQLNLSDGASAALNGYTLTKWR
jgi:hypothetical protein